MCANTYTVDSYAPTNTDPAAQLTGHVRPRITDGPAGLARSEAVDYMAARLRRLSGNAAPSPISDFGSWEEMALAALARADRRPTRPFSVAADNTHGCIVIATPLPVAA